MKEKEVNKILELLPLSQDELFDDLEELLGNYGYTIQRTDYALAGLSNKFAAPTLVAHLDTKNIAVHPTFDDLWIDEEWICLSSTANPNLNCLGADDRLGVASILSLLDKGYRPHVLFTRDEEIGCVGTRDLLSDDDNWTWLFDTSCFIQIDRGRHEGSWKEMVFYHYDYNHIPEFYDQLSRHYDLAIGSNTDVALLGEHFDKPLVNLSASYEYEHTRGEKVNLQAYKENQQALMRFMDWLETAENRHEWTYRRNEE